MFELALFAQVVFWLIVLGVFLASGQASLFHPLTVYLAFHGVVFVLRPLLVHYLGFDGMWRYMRFQPSETDLVRTLGVASLGLLAFSITCLSCGWAKPVFATGAPEPFTIAQKRALILTTLLLSPAIAYSIRSLMSGGLQGHHVGGTFVMTGASGYALEAQFMAGPLFCSWLAVTRFRWIALLPLLLYVAYRSYAGWNRWTIVLLFLAVTLVYAWQRRIRWLPAWAAALALPVFLLFQLLGQNRDHIKQVIAGEAPMQAADRNGGIPVEEKTKLQYDTQEFANFDFLCYVIAMVPERTGTYTYGAQYLQLLTEPIPRKLWKGKPAGAPVRRFNLNAYGNFLGLTPSLPGDGWMSGGWLGVIITLSVPGALLGLAHRWFWRHSADNLRPLFFVVGLAMLPQWFRDGGISISKFLFWNLSPLVLWSVLAWFCGPRLVPGPSVILPPGTAVRLLEPTAASRQTSHASSQFARAEQLPSYDPHRFPS